MVISEGQFLFLQGVACHSLSQILLVFLLLVFSDHLISCLRLFLIREMQVGHFLSNTLTLNLHSGRLSMTLAGAAMAMGPLCTGFTIVGLETVTVSLSELLLGVTGCNIGIPR